MKFGLRRTCADCPWRKDRDFPFFGRDAHGYARARQLAESFRGNHIFPCHKTAYWDDDGEQRQTSKTHACVGHLATQLNGEELGNLARIMLRIGAFDPDVIEPGQPVYNSLDEWVEAHNPEGPTQ